MSTEPGPDAPQAPSAQARATAALWLGLASIVFPPLGVLAIASGRAALVPHASPRDRRRALAGSLAGGISMCVTLSTLAALSMGRESDAGAQRGRATRTAPAALTLPDRNLGPRTAKHARAVAVERLGRLDVVHIGPTIRSLRDELARQHRVAQRSGRRVLLMATVTDCSPCGAMLEALPTPAVQRALSGTRVVALSADDFAIELARLGVPVNAFPGFALVGDGGRVLDYIHGGEWDDDVPSNIAPVLESFVRGTYHDRRDTWRMRYDDETPL